MYYVYILTCANGSFYTGYTTDIEKRLREHNGDAKGGAKYTRMHRPVTLTFKEVCESKQQAMQREAEIKQMTRREKLQLLASLSAN